MEKKKIKNKETVKKDIKKIPFPYFTLSTTKRQENSSDVELSDSVKSINIG